ncbi:hypothetical protein TNCV_3864981, partial [Trichonephila clavipes]
DEPATVSILSSTVSAAFRRARSATRGSITILKQPVASNSKSLATAAFVNGPLPLQSPSYGA